MKEFLQKKIKQAPTDPGVYHFLNSDKKIIYIGKAKNIRNRIRTYFQKSNNISSKNATMVKHVTDIEWIVVRNEVEALMTEANLIKEHQPRYNVDLKDDKSYPFIRITNEPFPQVFITRNIIRDGSKYYGPFTDTRRLRMILKALNKVFPIRSCSYLIDAKVIKEKKISICLDYHINKCEGPCEGLVSRDQYFIMVNRIEDFMRGKTKVIESHLNDMMVKASKEQRYEEAGLYRDQLSAIDSFKRKQSHVATDFTERDVIALAREGSYGVAVVLRIRNGKIFSRDKLLLKQLTDDEIIMKTVITRFYMDSDYLPKEISLQVVPADEQELILWMKERKKSSVKFIFPQKGEKAKELRVTMQNAKLLLSEWLLNRQKRKDQVPSILEQLKDDLNMDVPPRRIEAFDISHLGGTNTVASLVCFIDGRPKKTKYRKYNIKSVKGIDDFASMREVVFRRYRRIKEESRSMPDLILVDGGKGQLSMALSALRELGMDYIPIIGLAKKLEEVFVPGNSESQFIHKTSPGLLLLRRIRDEAHRFAITFQRKKRNKDLTKSIFNDIKGLGAKRSAMLLQSFSGPKQIAKQTPEEIRAKTGIPMKIVKEIIKVAKNYNSSII
ncbi:MAG: excinuclease ABC subunit UvrC [Candidatus Marinimicrobia bacterium]|jgi:excinuclease ABC subunit C|nr:excinuclease ABC subunit UvrC [Candidatus Neomarinimicrobiota bacterium]